MYFQVLEKKDGVFLLYYNGMIQKTKELPDDTDLKLSFSYHNSLEDIRDCDFARIISKGQPIDQIVDSNLFQKYQKFSNKLESYQRSYFVTNTIIKNESMINLIPKKFILDFCKIQEEIAFRTFENISKPKNYNMLLKINKVISDIETREVLINYKKLKTRSDPKLKKIKKSGNYIFFDPYISITGRMGTHKGSFPILNWPKKQRDLILPNNKYLIELDFNAAEIRTALGLSKQPQPDVDIHEWHNYQKFEGKQDRDSIKKDFFSWFFDYKKRDKIYERVYNREFLKERYFKNNQQVETIFDRFIEADRHLWFSYLIQSTSSDLFFDRVYEVWKFLLNHESSVYFTVHDSVIIDVVEKDLLILPTLKEIFSDTILGKFLTNVSWGLNYGNMKPVEAF